MIDHQTLCRRLHALEQYTAELERLASTLDRNRFETELATQWMVEHGLQLAIESVLDVGNHLVAGEGLGAPQSYREVIELLGERGILPPGFVNQVRGMPGFRNILVHDYLAVDLDTVWAMLQKGPVQFREFLRHIAAHIKPSASGPA
jgi:uncharacterized protein YutE (UPF0331/DUF86 family)